jgi:hypothetical protein
VQLDYTRCVLVGDDALFASLLPPLFAGMAGRYRREAVLYKQSAKCLVGYAVFVSYCAPAPTGVQEHRYTRGRLVRENYAMIRKSAAYAVGLAPSD